MDKAHKQIVEKVTKKVKQVGNSKAIFIPKNMAQKIGFKAETEVIISLENGRYGLYIALWPLKRVKTAKVLGKW